MNTIRQDGVFLFFGPPSASTQASAPELAGKFDLFKHPRLGLVGIQEAT